VSVVLLLGIALGASPVLARVPADPVALQLLRRSDSLFVRGRLDSSVAVIAPLETRARATGDRNLLMEIRLRQAAAWVSADRVGPGSQAAREGLALAEALDDSFCVRLGLRWLGYADLKGSHLDEAAASYRRLLALSLAAGDRRNEGFARGSLAYCDLVAGRRAEAERGYRAAGACFQSVGDTVDRLWTLVGLSRVQGDLGEYGRQRESYESIARAAAQSGATSIQADAINNLGTLEYSVGDPGRAIGYWERAAALHEQSGTIGTALSNRVNIAIAHADLGAYDEAARDLERLAAAADSGGFVDVAASALDQLAEVRLSQGRPEDAATIFRHSLSLHGASLLRRNVAISGLARALVQQGQPQQALDLLLRDAEPEASRLPAINRIELEVQIGKLERSVGRTAAARDRLAAAAADAETHGTRLQVLGSLVAEGRCERDLGDPRRARQLFDQAEEVWESERRVSKDPEWRVQRGQLAEELCFQLADLILADSATTTRAGREREAYDVLQRFKTRTQLERMAGPVTPALPGGDDAPITLVAVQHRLLRPGELLIDTFVGNEQALLYGITRDTERLVRIDDAADLAPAVRLYRDLITGHPAGDAAERAVEMRAARHMSHELLDGFADLVRHARRVIVAPDGPLHLLPVEELPFTARARDGERPLLAGREVVRIPSASLLARLRDTHRPAAARPLLALASATDDRGRPLPGAVAEVRWLTSRFDGVDARVFQPGAAPLDVSRLADYQVLHLAAHTRVDDQRPWNSGVLLAAGPGGPASTLEAAQIAASRLNARLAVLSGCESAGGRLVWGEGVEGLSAAFLSAGVPAVIATLWPVDDLATARFMRVYYDALARGVTAAAALRDAQSALRRDPATADPFYWAGFVLIGEGDVRVALRRRVDPRLVIAIGVAIAAALLLAGWTRRAGRADSAM
jgi:tetratricopeptide (TPR) repeat protein